MRGPDYITLAISVLALVFSVITYLKSYKHTKKKDTIDAFNIVQNEALDKLYFYTKSDIEEIAKDIKSKEYKEITLYLSRIEHFCVGINNDVYDIKILKSMAGECLCPLYDKLLPIIIKKRKISRADNVYSDFEKAVQRLKKEIK